ncbi:lipid droplet-regulating VLDL assembly factor AUP1-like isoform X3 [Myxocyprinus asiaticus]|uniref:lipid droplet-regulating VLDL assembly factor AUP1-like isoform X3 n=1 Tax=Myxocyprinus asiaticus TaxID=70543 RepID=UPI002221F614|nr:lipid droplet-regulating VLDL assembly factor AUP1-like isoform X3 [Myxocyprinus asiaticus]
METRGIDQMFDFQRLPSDGFILLLLLLYAPVGLCLMLLRIFIGVHVFLVSCALPDSVVRRFIVRIMCSVLGLHVRQNSLRLRDKSTRLYICNHVTHFDHNIINLLTSCNTPLLEGPAGFLCWARGYMELGQDVGSRSELTEILRRYCSSPGALPLLLFPEEDTTNGRAGLLKFSSWTFSVSDSIQPVALLVKRPFIAVNTPESSWLAELLWAFFVPFTVYHVRWLPPISREDGETHQEFASKVQELLATELGVISTQITKADKAEHIKRNRHTVPQTAHSSKHGFYVQTNCVDTTITNLLERNDQFHLEASVGTASGPAKPAASSTPSATASSPDLKLQPAAKSFEKTPVDRHMSLQERKDALYEYARRRYIEKGLNKEDGL